MNNAELIRALRSHPEAGAHQDGLNIMAADALEAQDKRITVLEADLATATARAEKAERSLDRAIAQRDYLLFDASVHVTVEELAEFSRKYDAALPPMPET